jgi:NTE family protein
MRLTKITILTGLLLCLAYAAAAQTQEPTHRPRIGLVLSGGGARGAAHIGVLKALDELHVPVDAIAGTSMGAVVGGLYASGMSGAEIEQALGSLDWQSAFRDRPPRTELDYRRKEEDRQFLVNLPVGLHGKKLVIPKGLLQGQKLTQVLRRLTLPVARITDFDRLPTRFRAVATDLETGEATVLRDGDLTTAMRASMSVPGLFAPTEYRGRLLVDGGLAENLPIDTAREMGVDVLIVVDAGYPLQSRDNLQTLASITNQTLAILVRRDASRQLATLGPRDIVLHPQLGNFSSYDFADTAKIVNAGAVAAEAMRTELAGVALTDEEFERYVSARAQMRVSPPTVEFVRAAPGSEQYERQINDFFSSYVGRAADGDALDRSVGGLYGRGDLELLDYRVAQDSSQQYGLDVTARRNSWGPNYLRFGVLLQDDFEGHTTFNAAGRLDFTELNSLGAESVWDLQVGTAPLLATELYLPLSNDLTRYFVAPHLQIEAHDLAQIESGKQVGNYRISSFDDGIDVGREFNNWGELRLGALQSRGNSHVSLGDFSVLPSDFNVTEYFLRFGYDTLDAANFPRGGQALTAQLSVEGSGGGERGTDLFTLDWRIAHSWAKNTIVTWLSSGSTVGGSQTNIRTYFPLGGFLSLSGERADTLAGPQYAIGRVIYLHKIGSGGEGILDVPAYLGMSFEAGNVWSSRSQMSLGSTRKDVALFFGADTYIGPAYLAAGYDEGGSLAFYLFLGRSF